MKKISHQEIQQSKPSPDEVKKKKRSAMYVLLENIRSLHNVGAIFRTADAVLVEKIFLTGITGQPPRKEINKTALGAEEVVPWEYHDDSVEVARKLKKKGVKIVAVELAFDAVDYSEADYPFPVCFIFGHEVEGVSDGLMEEVDMAVKIPMLGRANSLNVATCFGIIVYDALNKLMKKS